MDPKEAYFYCIFYKIKPCEYISPFKNGFCEKHQASLINLNYYKMKNRNFLKKEMEKAVEEMENAKNKDKKAEIVIAFFEKLKKYKWFFIENSVLQEALKNQIIKLSEQSIIFAQRNYLLEFFPHLFKPEIGASIMDDELSIVI